MFHGFSSIFDFTKIRDRYGGRVGFPKDAFRCVPSKFEFDNAYQRSAWDVNVESLTVRQCNDSSPGLPSTFLISRAKKWLLILNHLGNSFNSQKL